MKKQILLTVIAVLVFTSFAICQTTIDKSKLVGIWEQTDSIGNSLDIGKGMREYKIITPETFTVIHANRLNGTFFSLFIGSYSLENDTYVEVLNYVNPGAVKMIGTKNVFYLFLKNDLLYIVGINNPYKQIWKKLSKLPKVELSGLSDNL
jgi:hypothetical protein